jgi:hypothetical protein
LLDLSVEAADALGLHVRSDSRRTISCDSLGCVSATNCPKIQLEGHLSSAVNLNVAE